MRPQNRHLKPAQPGEVRNPAGRPKGSKHKLSEAFLRELTEAWEEHGKAALNKLAVEDPANFVAWWQASYQGSSGSRCRTIGM
jgi:hypothetical protein